MIKRLILKSTEPEIHKIRAFDEFLIGKYE